MGSRCPPLRRCRLSPVSWRATLLLLVLLRSTRADGPGQSCTWKSVFSGAWAGDDVEDGEDGVARAGCPTTLAEIRASYQTKYVCDTFHSRPFVRECALDAAADGAAFAAWLGPRTVAFVGDSLMMQQYFAFKCEMERLGANGSAKAWMGHHNFLREDIPCAATCAAGPAGQRPPEPHQCTGCGEGGVPRASPPVDVVFPWLASMPADTAVLVLGAGSWFNAHNGLAVSNLVFRQTVEALVPVFAGLQARGVAVVWLDLPAPPSVAKVSDPTYEWTRYPEKNVLARQALASLPGVEFLESARASGALPSTSARVPDSLLHWCNPGEHSVPRVITVAWLHLVTARVAAASEHP